MSHKITDAGCLIDGVWENNKITGDFLMIRPNGNCFVGSQANGELKGFIYPYCRLTDLQKVCPKTGVTPTKMELAERLCGLKSEGPGITAQQRFEKVFATGQVFYTPPSAGGLTRDREGGALFVVSIFLQAPASERDRERS